MTNSKYYSQGFRKGLSDGLPGLSFVEFVDFDTFIIDEDDEQAAKDFQRGYRDGRAARANVMKNADLEEYD